jgi:CelD/BcsL family acetyltransferase involved in cellulose biosynthesis
VAGPAHRRLSMRDADGPVAELIDLGALTPGGDAAWRDLAGRALTPNPFFEPDAVLAAHAHLGATATGLLVVREGGRWTACLPVRRVRVAGRGLVLRSWLHLYAFLGMPLVDREQPVRALEALLAAGVRENLSGVLILQKLPTDGAAAAAVHEALAACDLVTLLEISHERATLQRIEGDGYLEHLGSHHLREMRRLSRRLSDELGSPAEVVDRALDRAAVETFLRLEATGWKGRQGTAMASQLGDAEFFRALCDGFRASGRLQLLALEAGGRTAAMKCNLSAGSGLFCFKIAQDDELNRFSPGVQLEHANVACFAERRTELWMDSCAAPDNAMINRLWSDRRAVADVVVGHRGLRARVSTSGLQAVKRLRERRRRSAPPAERR